jgi:hypothetical protein
MTPEKGPHSGEIGVDTLAWADRSADRLWLAGMAMQGLIAQGSMDIWHIAHQAYAMADAMLEVEGQ